MPEHPTIQFKNLHKTPDGRYFVGFLKGKRTKYVEQAERYDTPEEALAALNLKP